uniref:Uncharacterized protein n=1 Tax=Pithovirus LCPAC401 TaxID=2506595 RepID=A0A481Z9E3_9VIRU|nr:MAG: hypothetical protein LCPAC401_01610 [Pithovirus LCPAC401]
MFKSMQKEESMDKAKKFIDWIHLNNIKVIAFDLDRTLTNRYSTGAILHTQLQSYSDGCSEDFKSIIFDLLEEKELHIAIVTYTDNSLYREYDKENYIAGWDLVNGFLRTIGLNNKQMKKIIKLCRSPTLHDEKYEGKLWHLDRLKTIFNISPKKILLFDDSYTNVLYSNSYRAIKVCGRSFSLDDIPLREKLTEVDWNMISKGW